MAQDPLMLTVHQQRGDILKIECLKTAQTQTKLGATDTNTGVISVPMIYLMENHSIKLYMCGDRWFSAQASSKTWLLVFVQSLPRGNLTFTQHHWSLSWLCCDLPFDLQHLPDMIPALQKWKPSATCPPVVFFVCFFLFKGAMLINWEKKM